MKPQFTITESLIEPVASDDSRWFIMPHAWFEDVEKQLRAIAELKAGWDGDRAERPKYESINAARWLLVSLCRAQNLTRPHVNPTRRGGIQFEWESGSRYLEIEVVGEGAATFFYCDRNAGTEDEGEVFRGESLDGVIAHIQDVAAGESAKTRTSCFDAQNAHAVV